MPIEQLFVTPVHDKATIEDLHTLFSSVENIENIEILTNQRTGLRRNAARLLVDYATPPSPQEIYEQFQGLTIDDYRVHVTPFFARAEISPPNGIFSTASRVATELNETERQPINQIARAIHHCSMGFVEQIIQDTLALESAGGLAIRDGSRMRTPGGIFFTLIRQRTSWKIQQALFLVHVKPRANKNGQKPSQPSHSPRSTKPEPRVVKKEAPSPPKIVLPPVDEAALAAARVEYNKLNEDYLVAEQEFTQLKATPPEARKTSLFSATRNMAALQKQIAELLSQFPHLQE
jgi:hypothetical protein